MPPSFEPGFHRLAEGSCLYRAGGTAVLCTVSCDDAVPAFLEGTGRGWLTAAEVFNTRGLKDVQKELARRKAL